MGRTATNVVTATTESIKKAIKDAAGNRCEFRIKNRAGLVLMTQTSGVGIFYYFYSPTSGGKARKLRLGTFPATSLAEATREAVQARARIDKGEDPFAAQAAQKASLTFKALAEKFVSDSTTLSAKSRSVYLAAFKKDVFPAFGDKPASAVTSSDILNMCLKIKSRGSLVQAQRTKTSIGGLYRWAMGEGHVKNNPADGVPNQQAVKSVRSRTPSLDEIGQLWEAIESSQRLSPPVKLIFKLTILTGQRRSEVAGARIGEVSGDVWTIAADLVKAGRIVKEGRMKNGTEQRVYLSRQAQLLFEQASKTTSLGDYFFPANTRLGETRAPHIHGDSITQAMGRLRQATGLADLTIHDMRRGLGNFLKDAGYGKEVRDLMLSHKDQSVDGVHYSSSARMEATCREAWQKWADYLDGVTKQPTGDAMATCEPPNS